MSIVKPIGKHNFLPLFTWAEDWKNNACLNYQYESMDLYARGYKKAADTLVEEVLRTANHQDILVYPILFLYRHYLELQLKVIIADGRRLLEDGEGFPQIHDLATLWSTVKDIARNVWHSPTEPIELKSVDHIISEYSKIDAGSFSFRYPNNRDGGPTLDGIQHINIRHAAEMISEAATFLDCVSLGLSAYLDYRNDNKD